MPFLKGYSSKINYTLLIGLNKKVGKLVLSVNSIEGKK